MLFRSTTRTGVHELLQDISQRLANIEAHLGIARPPVPLTAGTGGAEPGAETAETGLAAGGETGADAAGDGPAAAKE